MGLVALLTALIGFLNRVWPEKKTVGEIERDAMKEIHDADTMFDQKGDTTDLGRLP